MNELQLHLQLLCNATLAQDPVPASHKCPVALH